jgi:hypothetical protein
MPLESSQPSLLRVGSRSAKAPVHSLKRKRFCKGFEFGHPVSGLSSASILSASFKLGEDPKSRRDTGAASDTSHVNAAASQRPKWAARVPALAQPGVQRSWFAALMQAPAAKVVEAHSVAPVVMVDS